MSLDALLERALDAEGAEIEPRPDAWERLQARLDRADQADQAAVEIENTRHSETNQSFPLVGETAPAGGSPAGRSWRLAAAAGVVVLAGVAVVASLWPSASDDGMSTAGTTTPPDTTSAATVDPKLPADLPTTAVAVNNNGTLMRLHLDTGQVEILATSPAVPDVHGGDHIDGVAIGLDSQIVFSTCCEPITGETFRLGPDDRRTRLSFGHSPVFNPASDALAVSTSTGINVLALDGTLTHNVIGDALGGDLSTVAWSPDGDVLALELHDGVERTEVMVLPVASTSMDEAGVLTPPAGTWWSDPVFRADGSLLVIEHPTSGDGGSVLRRVVPGRQQPGAVVPPRYSAAETVELGGLRPLRLAAFGKGQWVLMAPAGGGAFVILGPDDTVFPSPVQVDEPLVDLDW